MVAVFLTGAVAFVAGWAACWRIVEGHRLTLGSIRAYWQQYHRAVRRYERQLVKDTSDLVDATRRDELEDRGPVTPARGVPLLERAMPPEGKVTTSRHELQRNAGIYDQDAEDGAS